MLHRRSFIRSASLLALGGMMDPSMLAFKKKPVGLQLYTVRDAMAADPAGTLARVAKIGYTAVEAVSYTGTGLFYGMKAADFAKLLKDLGLFMPSSHYRLGEEKTGGVEAKGTMMHGWQKAVDDAAEAGARFMVCGYLTQGERGGADRYRYVAGQLNKAAEVCKKAGIQMCYHNHDFEFEKTDGGVVPFDILLQETEGVQMELDLYWATKAGYAPVALIGRYPGRFPLWHVKDMDRTPARSFTEVGNGIIDFKKIFKSARKAGLQQFFVEQDRTPGSPFDSITRSYRYVKSHLI